MSKEKQFWEEDGHLEIKDHEFQFAGFSVKELAEEEGTPVYVLNGNRIESNYNRLFNAVQKNLKGSLKIHYAMKANSTPGILKLLGKLGSSIDAVSPYEVFLARDVGFSKDRILYTGTSVSNGDMTKVAPFVKMNIDSKSQLERYAKLVKECAFDPRVSIRINPGKGAGHVPECMTAGEDAKYGTPENQALEIYEKALELDLKPVGIHQHIGSQILEPDAHIIYDGTKKILDIAGKVKGELGVKFDFVDIGGGIGIKYKDGQETIDVEDFGKRIGNIVESKAEEYSLGNFDLYMEPGRSIVGDAGILLVKVVDVTDKYISEIGVNAGFNVLDRPARYHTYHEIVNVNQADAVPQKEYRVSGNLCESGDVFTESKHHLRKLPITEEGDILAILDVGAYGSTMGSNYNMRARAKEIMVYNGEVKMIKKRECFEDLIKNFM